MVRDDGASNQNTIGCADDGFAADPVYHQCRLCPFQVSNLLVAAERRSISFDICSNMDLN